VGDIYVAPDAAGFAGRETVGETDVVDFADDAADPAEAERFIDGFEVDYAATTSGFPIGADVEFGGGGVVLGELGTAIGGGFEKRGGHRSVGR
jgi:hypothetical protein